MDRQPQSKWFTAIKVAVVVLLIIVPFTTIFVAIVLCIKHLNHLRRTNPTPSAS